MWSFHHTFTLLSVGSMPGTYVSKCHSCWEHFLEPLEPSHYAKLSDHACAETYNLDLWETTFFKFLLFIYK